MQDATPWLTFLKGLTSGIQSIPSIINYTDKIFKILGVPYQFLTIIKIMS